jgi:hypothetical protein
MWALSRRLSINWKIWKSTNWIWQNIILWNSEHKYLYEDEFKQNHIKNIRLLPNPSSSSVDPEDPDLTWIPIWHRLTKKKVLHCSGDQRVAEWFYGFPKKVCM